MLGNGAETQGRKKRPGAANATGSSGLRQFAPRGGRPGPGCRGAAEADRPLRDAGPEGLACREVGCRMISRDPDITRLMDRMESRGLIARARGEEDRRVV